MLILFVIVGYAENNYMAYHRESNRAKVLISQNKFKSALAVYQSVFKKYPKHFYRDLHNACVCAIRCEEFNEAEKLAKKLILYGYTLKDFQTSTFESFRKSKNWKKVINNYPVLRNRYDANFNDYLNRKYYFMYKEDQKIASMAPMGNPDADQARWEITALLYQDYKMNGVPDFVRFKDSRYQHYFILYRHYFGTKNYLKKHPEIAARSDIYRKLKDLKLKDILLAELYKGNISPKFIEDAMSYFDNPYGRLAALRIDFNIEKVYMVPDGNLNNIAKIEENRRLIGMLPLHTEYKLAINNTWYSEYPFRQIKDSIENLKVKDAGTILKTVKQLENRKLRKYLSSDKNGFFLNNYAREDLKTKYIGLKNYVVNTK